MATSSSLIFLLVLISHESESDRQYQHEVLQSSLANLNLPVPERFMRANLRADGLRTPDPLSINHSTLLYSFFFF